MPIYWTKRRSGQVLPMPYSLTDRLWKLGLLSSWEVGVEFAWRNHEGQNWLEISGQSIVAAIESVLQLSAWQEKASIWILRKDNLCFVLYPELSQHFTCRKASSPSLEWFDLSLIVALIWAGWLETKCEHIWTFLRLVSHLTCQSLWTTSLRRPLYYYPAMESGSGDNIFNYGHRCTQVWE